MLRKMLLSKRLSATNLAIALSLVGFLASPSFAANSEGATENVAEKMIQFTDNLGRDTPRSSFTGFLKAAEQFKYQQAAKFLDMRNLPSRIQALGGQELARELDFIIKRGMKIDPKLLSNSPEGQVVDGLPEYRDELGPIVTDQGEIILLLQRVPSENGKKIWKVSNESLASVPELYDFFSYPEWVERIHAKLPANTAFLGIELFKWVIVLGFALLGLPLFWLAGYLISWLISRPGQPLHEPIKKLFTRPLPLWVMGLLSGYLLKELGLGATAQKIIEANTLMTIIVVWIIFSLIDLARAKRAQTFIKQGRSDAHILGRPMANALKLVTLLIAILMWLNNAGIDISTLLAGLGIGGIALALAMQKPIEDLLGAVSIYSQQPIVTGDLCKYGDVTGKVEEIGLRTTRIRTLSNTLVSIPNAIIAHGAIENLSARESMLYHPSLQLRYDTSLSQIQTIISELTELAKQQPKVIAKTVRVSFAEFAEHAIIIKVRIYVDEDDFSRFLAVVTELNLGIMQIIQNAGAHFAQGAQTIMLANKSDKTVN